MNFYFYFEVTGGVKEYKCSGCFIAEFKK